MLVDDPFEDRSRGPAATCFGPRRRDGSRASVLEGRCTPKAGEGRWWRWFEDVDLSSVAEDWSDELVLGCRVLVWANSKG